MKKLMVLIVLALFSLSVFAKSRTVTLEVPSMSCITCPITVRKALEKVPGVTKARATYKPKEAVVTFDDEKTSVAALIKATTNAGYPSTLKQP